MREYFVIFSGYEGVFRDFFWRKDHFEGRRVFSILKKDYESK